MVTCLPFHVVVVVVDAVGGGCLLACLRPFLIEPNTSSQTPQATTHSRLVLAVSGSAQSVFVGSNQIEASEEKLYFARRRYTDREQGERNTQGERSKTLILAACALGHVENTEERCRKRRDLFGNPA